MLATRSQNKIEGKLGVHTSSPYPSNQPDDLYGLMHDMAEMSIPESDDGIDTTALKSRGNNQPQCSPGPDLCDGDATSCIARSLESNLESSKLESLVHTNTMLMSRKGVPGYWN